MAETQEPDWTSVRRVVTATGSHVEPPLDVDWPELWQLRWLAAAVGDAIGITISVNENPKVRGRYGLSYRYGNASVGTTLSHSSAHIWAQLTGMQSGYEIAKAGGSAESETQPVGYAVGFVDDGLVMLDSNCTFLTLDDAKTRLVEAEQPGPETPSRLFELREVSEASCCPACGKQSEYHRDLDRYVHSDGSPNDPCWLRTLRGELREVRRG